MSRFPPPPPPHTPVSILTRFAQEIRPSLFGIVSTLDVFRDKAVYKYVRSGKFATNIKDVFYVKKNQQGLIQHDLKK